MPTENLQAAKFVATVRNPRRRICTEDIHLLELGHDRRPQEGNRRTDSRQHGIIRCKLLSSEIEIRSVLSNVNRELQSVEDFHVVSAFNSCLLQATCAVATDRGKGDILLFHFLGLPLGRSEDSRPSVDAVLACQ
jgi:hypothetical protein